MTTRGAALGFSTDKSNKTSRSLADKGILTPFTINAGQHMGGMVKLHELTRLGAETLGVKQKLVRRGNTSAEHFWWQIQICSHFRGEGHQASIEKSLDGQRADVGVHLDGSWIAYEVAITPRNELRNILKDLEAGFQSVVVCCRSKPVSRAVALQANEHLAPDQLSRTRIVLLCDLPFVSRLFKPAAGGRTAPHQI